MLTNRFEEALVFATRLHSKQLRKASEVPYISHLLGVTSIALEHGANEDEAIGALLHDAVEDQGGLPTLELIRQTFGDTVADIVQGCSDTEVFPKPPWRERKEHYLAHIKYASPAVLLVSASDKLHNVRSILTDYRRFGHGLWERFRGGREGTLWYYQSLVREYTGLAPVRLVEELKLAVVELEKIAQ